MRKLEQSQVHGNWQAINGSYVVTPNLMSRPVMYSYTWQLPIFSRILVIKKETN